MFINITKMISSIKTKGSILKKVTLGIFAIAIVLAGVVYFGKAKESSAQGSTQMVDVTGYAWSSNIGWIKFSGSGYGVKRNAPLETTEIDDVVYTDVSPYEGDFSGHAWSSNLGWLSFNRSETGNPPSDDIGTPGDNNTPIAKLENGQWVGWARFLSGIDTEDNGAVYEVTNTMIVPPYWDGWVKFNGQNYGVELDQVSSRYEGYAWGDKIVGWVKFNIPTAIPDPNICDPNVSVCDGGGSSPSVNLSVDNPNVNVNNPTNIRLSWTLNSEIENKSGYTCTKTADPYPTDPNAWNGFLLPKTDGSKYVSLSVPAVYDFTLSCTNGQKTSTDRVRVTATITTPPEPPTGTCTQPPNTLLCLNQGVAIPANGFTLFDSSASCPKANPAPANKCQYYCKSGFVKRGNQCVLKSTIEEN